MDKFQKNALRKCRVRLVSDLVMDELLDSVETHGIFTSIMLECIKAKESRPEKARLFLDYLQRRGPRAFDKFLLCLRESGHQDMASLVIQALENEKGQGVSQINVDDNEGSQVPPPTTTTYTSPPSIYHTQESSSLQEVQGQMSRSLQESKKESELAMEVEGGDDNMETNPSLSGVQETISLQPVSDLEETVNNIRNVAVVGQSTRPSVDMQPSDTQTNISRSNSSVPVSLSPGYTGNLKEEYKMESDPRGLLLIINNRDFDGDMGCREGTDVDCEALRKLFLNLGFGVDTRQNLTAREMSTNLYTLSRLEQLRSVDCLAVAILTHGSEDKLYGVDAQYILTSDLMEPFTSQHCPALHNKPKFFIFNACRGESEDKGAPSLKLVQPEFDDFGHFSDVSSLKPTPTSITKIPSMQDFLLAYSTIPGYVSWRHMNDGSWFIQELAKVFEEQASRKHVVDMLVTVNRKVAEIVNSKGVQIPAPSVMLTKDWYLNPL